MAANSPEMLRAIFGEHEAGLPIEEIAKQSRQKFVRGKYEIAFYDQGSTATGHVLTALEAYHTFGLDILEEAAEYGSAIILRKRGAIESSLKVRREGLGLSRQSVARAARGLLPTEVKTAETDASDIPIQSLERIAFTLGLDESKLAFHLTSGADEGLAVRLRTLHAEPDIDSVSLSAGAVLTLAEAASIIRVQSQLQAALGTMPSYFKFAPNSDYGYRDNLAYRIGYRLAEQTRARLGLADNPIYSMRELVEETLGIPVIQARMPDRIAGATVAVKDNDGYEYRGIVLNTVGQNENVWVRRITLAHEIGHLLHDPEDKLDKAKVDSYDANDRDPEIGATDYVEQRANAFAIAFLAPNGAVRELAQEPTSGDSVSKVMRTFGISRTAAQFHISNSWYRQYPIPRVYDIPETWPSDEQKAAENFSTDYFPIENTPTQRRGRFAGIIVAAYDQRLISDHTVAAYLNCGLDDFYDSAEELRGLYPVPG